MPTPRTNRETPLCIQHFESPIREPSTVDRDNFRLIACVDGCPMALDNLTSPERRRMPCVNRNIGRPTPRRLATCVKKPSLAVLVLGPPIDMASPNFLWARHVYLPFTVIVVPFLQNCISGSRNRFSLCHDMLRALHSLGNLHAEQSPHVL